MDNIQDLTSLPIERKKLKDWIKLENMRGKIKESLKAGDPEDFSFRIINYVSFAYNFPIEEIENRFWYDIAMMYDNACLINDIRIKIPMLLYPIKQDESKEVSYNFDYEEREWFVILNTFCKNYGWTIREVEEMDVDDAFPLLQEIRLQSQFEKEFIYSLSEIAYPYDENRKLHIFKPLERPEWMKEVVKVLPPKKTKIRKDMLPVGLIIRSPGNVDN